IYSVATGSEAKILVADDQSERHPDLLIYKTPPPATDVWSTWVPEIVIEVVSANSATRHYEEKPPEYLAFGVSEYWIVYSDKGQMTVLRRSGGRWAPTVLKSGETYRTRLLSGLELNLAAVLDAAKT
ncbi:MAG: Uma2 family endonuclease, partial [Verrucomicrobiota bacterium]|nr:Uma2 family endonuclease [Verrucomicrobiota bacterium]